MTTKPFHFEEALNELEQITQWFESGDADLDQGITKFERGLELAASLRDHLQTVENRVEKIKQRFTTMGVKPDLTPSQEVDSETSDSEPELFGE